MSDSSLYDLRFPIGEFKAPQVITSSQISSWSEDIEVFPGKLDDLTLALSVDQLQWKYRPEGWSIKQVVHHCADSHMNCIIRFKLALTEEKPVIRPYFEDRWSELSDNLDDDLTATLLLLHGLHSKLGKLLRNLSEVDLKKEFVHPEHGISFRLDENIGIYAWHCNHHLAHIRQAIRSEGKY